MAIERIKKGVYRAVARLRVNGKIVQRQTTSDTLEQAKAALEKLKAELRKTGGWRSLTVKTFGDVLDFYTTHHTPKKGYYGKSISLVNRLKRDLGAVPIRALDESFNNYLQALRQSTSMRTGRALSNGMINRVVSWTKAALNHAVESGLISKNPLSTIEKLKETHRERLLSPDERQRLLNVLALEAPHLLPAVNFALRIPCRTNEIVNMQKGHLNLLKGTITVPGEYTKNGHPCVKLIPPDMVDYFRTLPKETEYLFYRQGGTGFHSLGCFKRAWHRALKLAGIGDFRFHDLRHCAITSLRNAGTPDHIIHILAGWKNGDYMMRTYYGFQDEKLFELVRFPVPCEGQCEGQKVSFG